MPLLPTPPDPAACPWVHAELLVTGDVMAHMDQVDAAERPDGWDFSQELMAVAPWISGADLAMANLETVFGGEERRYTGFPAFNTPDALATNLVDAGFDLVQTVNNHCLDRGGDGVLRTREVLTAAGLPFVGTWDGPDLTPWETLELEGARIVVATGTFSYNGYPLPKGMPWAATPMSDLGWIVAKAAPEADFLIAGVHWGWEYELKPRAPEIALADSWVDAGADLVWAHHPHVVQPLALRPRPDGDALITYSHGNFVSGQRTFPRDGGLMTRLDLAICPNTRQVVLSGVRLLPTWVDLRAPDGHKWFRVVPADAAWLDADPSITPEDRRSALTYRAHLERLLGPDAPLGVDPPGVVVRREELAWAADPTGLARTARFVRGELLDPAVPVE